MSGSDLLGLFGYGSLLDKKDAYNCQLRGWRREWKHCLSDYVENGISCGPVCALTVTEYPAGVVRGAVRFLGDTTDLDQREQGYVHASLAALDLDCEGDISAARRLFLYRSDGASYRDGTKDFPIWYSYLETVLLAFNQRYGMPGVEEFIATTSGWETPILDDRDAPIYSRARKLSAEERTFADGLVNRVPGGAHIGKLNMFSR